MKRKVTTLVTHQLRHKLLHDALDELSLDFIKTTGSIPSETSLLEFLEWSIQQRKMPQGDVDEHNQDRRYYHQ